MGYVIKIGTRHYVKRTARFGAFHGTIYLTDSKQDALVFTRKADAERRASVLAERVERYHDDNEMFARRGLSTNDILIVDVIEQAG